MSHRLGGDGTGEQWRAWRPALPAPGAEPSPGRRCWRVRVPPSRQPTGVEVARPERRQRRGGGRGAAERMRAAAREAAEQTGQCQRISDALVGRRQGLERRLLPAEASDRLGDGVRQRAPAPSAASAAGAVRPASRSARSSGCTQACVWARSPAASVSARRASSPSRTVSAAAATRASSRASASVASASAVSSTGRSAAARQSPSPDGDGCRREGKQSASVSSGVSSQGGRSRASAMSASSPWCAERDATPLPCPPGLLCAYLSSLAKTGLRPSTIGRRASGVGHVHRQHGFEPPTNAEAVKAVLRGIRRELGTARRTKTPATHDIALAITRPSRGMEVLHEQIVMLQADRPAA